MTIFRSGGHESWISATQATSFHVKAVYPSCQDNRDNGSAVCSMQLAAYCSNWASEAGSLEALKWRGGFEQGENLGSREGNGGSKAQALTGPAGHMCAVLTPAFKVALHTATGGAALSDLCMFTHARLITVQLGSLCLIYLLLAGLV